MSAPRSKGCELASGAGVGWEEGASPQDKDVGGMLARWQGLL